MHAEYNESTLIAEQAISSIRTVYSFVGEEKAIAKFSSSLAGTVKLGLKQGLAKGLSIGGNRSVIFVLWAFMSWYGSRLAINHAASGGRILQYHRWTVRLITSILSCFFVMILFVPHLSVFSQVSGERAFKSQVLI